MAIVKTESLPQCNHEKHITSIQDEYESPHSAETTTSGPESPAGYSKPIPGSVEWYERRKENHKRVERKRRETINRAMEDLGAVIPGNEKNKSRLLSRAVQHIKGLRDELVTLRSQLDQYRLADQKNKTEIADLVARLDRS